jgi:hypothetical protein
MYLFIFANNDHQTMSQVGLLIFLTCPSIAVDHGGRGSSKQSSSRHFLPYVCSSLRTI